MCGRTTLTITPDDLERSFGYAPPADYRPRFNIAPTQKMVAIADGGSGVGLTQYRWGLIPFWAKDQAIGNRLINARAEGIASKPAFREAFARRRCLIVVDGFYEWQVAAGGKRPHRICAADGAAFTLAGVWEKWAGDAQIIESCAIITTTANELMSPIHDRMPVVVAADDRACWLGADTRAEELAVLLRPYEGADLVSYEVSTIVNNPANDLEDCIAPFGELDLFASG
jgi:putative SOS response-associated peptidase YedK